MKPTRLEEKEYPEYLFESEKQHELCSKRYREALNDCAERLSRIPKWLIKEPEKRTSKY